MEKYFVAAAMVIGLVAGFVAGVAQREIADNVIRFHVRAAGNSAADLALKYHVRDAVLREFEPILAMENCIDTMRGVLEDELPRMQQVAQAALAAAGSDMDVRAEMGFGLFPMRTYGDTVFPPGRYEAVQITLGAGGGGNWWCLMFPPLCYVSMAMTPAGEEYMGRVQVRFRVVEWWNELWQ
jgi:stage II sporulation protein R